MAISRLRTPALAPLPPEPARAHAVDPTAAVLAHFRRVWETTMRDLPFVNPALTVEATPFERVAGDWLGVVVTPWFINVLLLPGGGALWEDWPTGEQRSVRLPVGAMDFIADNPGPGVALPAYQYCPLIAPVQSVADMAAAREIAGAALATLLVPPPGPIDGDGQVGGEDSPDDAASPSRRGFLRRLSGR